MHTRRSEVQEYDPGFLRMQESNLLVPKNQSEDGALAIAAKPREPYDAKQRRLMVVALVLLLVTLGAALYADRSFWFPNNDVADIDQTADTAPGASSPARSAPATTTPALKTGAKAKHNSPANKPENKVENKTAAKTPPAATPSAPPAATASTTRTVLPPLEVEVVAGDSHRTVRPGSNSVRVDLQPGAPTVSDAVGSAETAANVTNNAAERVQMSADTSAAVSRSVTPGYPLLARQMKVQGSVILQALISREGTIQGLHVVSGPPILASAAQDAVRQWHFKPHYQNNEAVETQAKITVNFTISTN